MQLAVEIIFYISLIFNISSMLFNSLHLFLFFYGAFFGKKYIHNKKKQYALQNKQIINKTFAIIVAARNESSVIKDIINSLKSQTYEDKYYDIYVVADNCTDNTAEIARQAGAIVFERFDESKRGANFAIQYALKNITSSNKKYDAYCYFDSDNIVDKNWLSLVNLSLNDGNDVVTTFRNSLNFGDNWISASYAIQFFIESRYMNLSRSRFKGSSFVNGTGFCFTDYVLKLTNGWDFNSLSHDIEFTQFLSLNNIKCAYVNDALFYDEQPIKFKDSYRQRLRWSKGFLQVFNIYSNRELKYLFNVKNKNKMSVWANLILISPQIFLLIFNIITWIVIATLQTIMGADTVTMALSWALTPVLIFFPIYIYFLIQSIITVSQNIDRIKCPKKLLAKYCFMYPIFMISYAPIGLIALFKRKVNTNPINRKQRT